jgi:hypothetical protein
MEIIVLTLPHPYIKALKCFVCLFHFQSCTNNNIYSTLSVLYKHKYLRNISISKGLHASIDKQGGLLRGFPDGHRLNHREGARRHGSKRHPSNRATINGVTPSSVSALDSLALLP